MGIGEVQTALNFYTYGKKRFTQTGYEAAVRSYAEPDFHESVDLSGKNFMVTGANSGIGKEMAIYLAKKGAAVYMVCRSPDRGEKARAEIVEESKNKAVHLLLCDVGLESDVRKMWASFTSKAGRGKAQLHGLVCNAGALLNERTLNAEGAETTFAAHLACGTYLLGKLAMPVLENTPGSRMVIVTSGGMYNSKFPGWEVITSTAPDSVDTYDGNIAYTWAKRGQVLLAREWAKRFPKVKFASAHPGWAATEGVDTALAKTKHLLEPMRTAWQGAEGMCWLLACKAEDIKTGEFYLDRAPQKQHIAGWFWTEGGRTKNSEDEVAMMMLNLERFVNRDDPLYDMWHPTAKRTAAKLAARAEHPKLVATTVPMELGKFMRRWYVLANMPIFAMNEQNLYNPVEFYMWDEANQRVQVVYKYSVMGDTAIGEARQHGFIADPAVNTAWSLNPKLGIYLPLGLGYLVLYVAPNYEWVLIGVPDRKFLWIMTATLPSPKDPQPFPVAADPAKVAAAREKGLAPKGAPSEKVLAPKQETAIMKEALLKAEAAGYDISQVRMCGWYHEVPHATEATLDDP